MINNLYIIRDCRGIFLCKGYLARLINIFLYDNGNDKIVYVIFKSFNKVILHESNDI